MRASIADFLPDEELAFRSIGSEALTETTATPSMPLAKLEAYWSTDEWGIADKLQIVVNIRNFFLGEDYDEEGDPQAEPDPIPPQVYESYVISAQVDSTEAFSTPTTVASLTINEDYLDQYIVISIDPEDMVEFDKTAKYIRLVATMEGEAPSLTYSAYIKS